jgi:N6-adenosine-specific RNA methylase IME4
MPYSVIDAEVAEHSKKPDKFRETPNLTPRLEMFARGKPYPGFIAWGNEAQSAIPRLRMKIPAPQRAGISTSKPIMNA